MAEPQDMPALDLGPIKVREAVTTPGPWVTDPPGPYSVVVYGKDGGGSFMVAGGARPEDGRFIAHARTDVPALVAEVDRLRAELDRREAE